jgi:hypothetical protein
MPQVKSVLLTTISAVYFGASGSAIAGVSAAGAGCSAVLLQEIAVKVETKNKVNRIFFMLDDCIVFELEEILMAKLTLVIHISILNLVNLDGNGISSYKIIFSWGQGCSNQV